MGISIDKKAVFHLVLGFLPGHIGKGARMIEDAITGSATKKQKALEIALAGLATTKELATVSQNPKFIEAMGKVNDALIAAANIAQQLADAEVLDKAGDQTPPSPQPFPVASPQGDGTP